MRNITEISNIKRLAKKRVPKWIFEYADAGSYTESTYRANRRDLSSINLRQKVLVDVSERRLDTTILGETCSLPVAIAPTGLSGFFYPNGEIHAARAAEYVGVPYCLSTVSICSIEDVRANTSSPFWFQIYVMRDRGATKSLIERALAAECSALVVTVDLPLQARRHKDIVNGLTVPPRLSVKSVLDILRKPKWALGMAAAGKFGFGNLKDLTANSDMTSFAEWVAGSFDASVTWEDLDWVRSIWPGKLIVKGIMDEVDAIEASKCGVDAIVVSNHGGRQLDGAPSSISRLAQIADRVGASTEILFDGGVESGQDVVRAIALGARGCLIGRAHLYGLAAFGEPGVRQVLDILRNEIDLTIALTGCKNVSDINANIIA